MSTTTTPRMIPWQALMHAPLPAGQWFTAWTRRAGAWLYEMAMDDRSRHIAAAVDHDDLLRRERDCAAFEQRCAAIPLVH